MKKKSIDYSIVIPCLNAASTISMCLDSIFIFQNDSFSFEVILVDCDSTDDTLEISKLYPVKLLQSPKKNPSIARNVGAKTALGKVIIFVDANSVFPQNLFERLTDSYKLADAWQFKIVLRSIADTTNLFSRLLFKLHSLNPTATFEQHGDRLPLLNTAIFAVKKDAFHNLQGFNQLFLRCEDRDFGARLLKSNHNIMYISDAIGIKIHREMSWQDCLKKLIQEAYYRNIFNRLHDYPKLSLNELLSTRILDDEQKKKRNHKTQVKNEYWVEFFWQSMILFCSFLPVPNKYKQNRCEVHYSRNAKEVSLESHKVVVSWIAQGYYFSNELVTFSTVEGLKTFDKNLLDVLEKIYNTKMVNTKEWILLNVLKKYKVVTLEQNICEI